MQHVPLLSMAMFQVNRGLAASSFSFLPLLVAEKNLWGEVAQVSFYGLDALCVTKATTLKH